MPRAPAPTGHRVWDNTVTQSDQKSTRNHSYSMGLCSQRDAANPQEVHTEASPPAAVQVSGVPFPIVWSGSSEHSAHLQAGAALPITAWWEGGEGSHPHLPTSLQTG